MYFDIISDITDIKTIAINRGIRELTRLRKWYGAGRWRKRKGTATVLLPDGTARTAELHWYEATGIGRVGQAVEWWYHQPDDLQHSSERE
jgi:hypothetical protein